MLLCLLALHQDTAPVLLLQALEPCTACLDLLLRWCVLRLADGNTQTLVSVTSMLKVGNNPAAGMSSQHFGSIPTPSTPHGAAWSSMAKRGSVSNLTLQAVMGRL